MGKHTLSLLRAGILGSYYWNEAKECVADTVDCQYIQTLCKCSLKHKILSVLLVSVMAVQYPVGNLNLPTACLFNRTRCHIWNMSCEPRQSGVQNESGASALMIYACKIHPSTVTSSAMYIYNTVTVINIHI